MRRRCTKELAQQNENRPEIVPVCGPARVNVINLLILSSIVCFFAFFFMFVCVVHCLIASETAEGLFGGGWTERPVSSRLHRGACFDETESRQNQFVFKMLIRDETENRFLATASQV